MMGTTGFRAREAAANIRLRKQRIVSPEVRAARFANLHGNSPAEDAAAEAAAKAAAEAAAKEAAEKEAADKAAADAAAATSKTKKK
ncbi:hypothetical protein [Bradyrhizobium sp. HKCCYLS20291]|uniref:hypothetical protein n=1 Tax=Bradyrhizobium sp. HKCCYLS20291 TaxID=3420766 RepID=UPI003EBA334C